VGDSRAGQGRARRSQIRGGAPAVGLETTQSYWLVGSDPTNDKDFFPWILLQIAAAGVVEVEDKINSPVPAVLAPLGLPKFPNPVVPIRIQLTVRHLFAQIEINDWQEGADESKSQYSLFWTIER
jgi:hypothetical protein